MANSKKKLKRKWLFRGGLGCLLVGTGVSFAIESGFLRHSGAPLWQWVLAGTVSLAILIYGVLMLIKTAFLEQKLKE